MTERSWFWGGTSTGDAALPAPYGAPYSDDMFSDIFSMLMVTDRDISGVLPSTLTGYSGNLAVTTTSGSASVATGIALVDGKIYSNSASVNLTYSGDGNWSVVLRKSWSAQTIRAQLISTASITHNDGVTWDVELARIVRAGGAISSIVDKRIFVRMPKETIPWMAYCSNGASLGVNGYDFPATAQPKIIISFAIPYNYRGGLRLLGNIWSGSLVNTGYVFMRSAWTTDPADMVKPYTTGQLIYQSKKTFTHDASDAGMDGSSDMQILFDETIDNGVHRGLVPGVLVEFHLERYPDDAGDTDGTLSLDDLIITCDV